MKEGKCPFLEMTTVQFCKAFPVKKIPVDKISSSKGLCNTISFQECSLFREINTTGKGTESVRGFLLKTDRYFHPRHSWVAVSAEHENEARLGVDDFTSRIIGRIDRISVPSEGAVLKENSVAFLLHSGKRTARLVAPADGVIKAVNPKIAANPSLINDDPYHEGWILSMHLGGEGVKGLFYGSAARKWLECEVERLHRMFVSDLGITATDGGETLPDISSRLNEAQWSRIVNQFLG